MSSIFGGSKQRQNSSNQAYGAVSGAMAPIMGNAATGSNALAALLSGDTTGFDAFKRATGFDAMAEQGSRGITGNAAAGGLLRSGSTGKALSAFGNNIQNTFANSYMDKLLQQAGLGFNAANAMTAAGSQSSGSSKSKPGIGGFLGQLASGVAASDERLKMNITKLGEFDNGLGIYQYDYIDGRGPFVGVMAHEVEAKLPEALGPEIAGYKTVDYDKLKTLV